MGGGGSVTSTATLNGINISGDEVFTATSVLTVDEDASGDSITVNIPDQPAREPHRDRRDLGRGRQLPVHSTSRSPTPTAIGDLYWGHRQHRGHDGRQHLTPVTTSPRPCAVGTTSPVLITAYKADAALVSRVAYVTTDSDGHQGSCA